MATATIVTAGFTTAAKTHRRLLKAPDLVCAEVPHPIVSMTDEDLHASADAIFDEIAVALTRDGTAREQP